MALAPRGLPVVNGCTGSTRNSAIARAHHPSQVSVSLSAQMSHPITAELFREFTPAVQLTHYRQCMEPAAKVDPADPGRARSGRSDARKFGRIDRMVGGYCSRLERRSDSVRVGRQTSTPPPTSLATPTSTWRIWSVHTQAITAPTPVHGPIADSRSSDPLGLQVIMSHGCRRPDFHRRAAEEPRVSMPL
jgi:hypothetical protein